MNLLSGVRLGVGLKLLPGLSVYTLNQIMIFTQSAHLEQLAGIRLLEKGDADATAPATSDACSPARVPPDGGEDAIADAFPHIHGTPRVTAPGPLLRRKAGNELQLHRPRAEGARDGPRGGDPAPARLRRHGAHPARADPRGRGRGGGGPDQPLRGPGAGAGADRGVRAPGQGDHRARRAAVHVARQEGARVRDGRGARAEPLVRGHRAPAARPAARGEGDRRRGAEPARRDAGGGAPPDAEAARLGAERPPGDGRRHRPPEAAGRPRARRSPRRRRWTTSAAT
jgi:hypothetical protein